MARPLGTPTWLDYGTPHFQAAQEFYEGLFGWNYEVGGEETHFYTMVGQNGAPVAGMMDTSGMTCPDGGPVPVEWSVYLSVDDITTTLDKATASGGTVVSGPHSMDGIGKFAMVIDPAGATIGLWEDDGFEGYVFNAQHGTPVWFELMSMDAQKSLDFYTAVFDFTPVAMPGDGEVGYWTNGAVDQASSGICAANEWFPEGTQSFWRVYFQVPNADDAANWVKAHGGAVLDGPVDSPFGRIVTVADPQGATLQLNQPPN